MKGKYKHIFSEIKKLTALNSNIYLLDTYDILCPGEICKYRNYNFQLYGDDNHLSQKSVERLVYPKLLELIESELRWIYFFAKH